MKKHSIFLALSLLMITLAPTTVVGCGVDREAEELPLIVPDVPPELAVPDGHELYRVLRGDGVQIYTCTAATSANTPPTWQLFAPRADLMNHIGLTGNHYGGVISPLPETSLPGAWWRDDVDESYVHAIPAMAVKGPAKPDAIQELLIPVHHASATGTFAQSNASYIQRVKTAGGLAPANGCTAQSVGTKVEVEYGAMYAFWRLKQ